MFFGRTENKSISKIHKRILRLINDMKDTTLNLLGRDNSRTIYEHNITRHYKSTHYINPPVMWNFFDSKRNR